MTAPIEAPAAIHSFITATNSENSEAFVAAFTEDAVLDDWGNIYSGSEGIAKWNRTDNIGKHSRFELVSISADNRQDTFVAVLAVSGDGYNGTGPMTFELHGNKIARLTISPN